MKSRSVGFAAPGLPMEPVYSPRRILICLERRRRSGGWPLWLLLHALLLLLPPSPPLPSRPTTAHTSAKCRVHHIQMHTACLKKHLHKGPRPCSEQIPCLWPMPFHKHRGPGVARSSACTTSPPMASEITLGPSCRILRRTYRSMTEGMLHCAQWPCLLRVRR